MLQDVKKNLKIKREYDPTLQSSFIFMAAHTCRDQLATGGQQLKAGKVYRDDIYANKFGI